MNDIKIEKLDNQGRGICYIDSKITFVKNALPGEFVNLRIIKETKKYNEAVVTKYLTKSSKRIPSLCPYADKCGGCPLLTMNYEDTLVYKKEKLEDIFYKYTHLTMDIPIIANPNPLHYRNKITLKVINSSYGYYESSSHDFIKITTCYLASPEINDVIKDLKYLNLQNGEVTIRSNYHQELLIWLKTTENPKIDINSLKNNHKIVGIILNDQTIYGENKFVEIINNYFYTVSYDSFFQINRYVCSLIFDELKKYVNKNEVILDLYCGVGTLGISVSKNTRKIYGIEIVKNAILNAVSNAQINKVANAYYMLGNTSKVLPQIKDQIDTIIVDPPRSGLDKTSLKTIIAFKPTKIIYISCDPITLARDLKELLNFYEIKTLKGFDMFSYTYHVESVTVLCRKNLIE